MSTQGFHQVVRHHDVSGTSLRRRASTWITLLILCAPGVVLAQQAAVSPAGGPAMPMQSGAGLPAGYALPGQPPVAYYPVPGYQGVPYGVVPATNWQPLPSQQPTQQIMQMNGVVGQPANMGQPVYQLPIGQPANGMALQGSPQGASQWIAPGPAGGMIVPVQNTAESARTVHALIESMPTSQEELEIIDRRSQLMVTRENLIRIAIADPNLIEVVQYSPREISIIGLGLGTTTVTLWFENHPAPLIYLVKIIRDPNLDQQRRVDYGKLEKKLQTLFPNSKVYLIPLSNKIIVRGQARDQEEAAHILNIVRGEVINQEGSLFGPQPGNSAANLGNNGLTSGGYAGGYDPGGNALGGGGRGLSAYDLAAGFIVNELRVPGEFQILMKWRIAELNRSHLRSMGVDLDVLFNDGRHALTSALGGAPGTLSGVFENGEIGIFLDWLASNGTATLLTAPATTVLSGRQVRFLSGGEFAVPTIVGIGGAQGQQTSFRGFGTSVLATPTVVDRDLIRLQAVVEYSDINNDNAVQGIPGTNTRRIETTVELREGQTLALAGLLSNIKTMENNRIPFLGDIPKIGNTLFSSKRTSQDENELLILVSPEIVRPMDAHEVPPVPGHEVTPPTDHEFYFRNQLEGTPDTGHYHLPPYGSGAVGTNVGYQHFNPGPGASLYSPVPTGGQGQQLTPTPLPMGGTQSDPRLLQPVPLSSTRGMPAPRGAQGGLGRSLGGGWSTPQAAPQSIIPTNHTTGGSSGRYGQGPLSRTPVRNSY